MTHYKSNRIAVLAAAGLSLGLVLQAPSAWGQTATNLICNGCVQGSDIQNGTIGPNKLIPGSINATTIANGVIGPNKLIPGSINTATIANNAIRSNKILDGAVKSADIGDGEVASIDIQNSSITSIDIAPNTITQSDIATNGVGAAEIAASAVGSSEIATSAVFSGEVANNSLFDFDLADEAGLDFVNDLGFGTDISLTPTYTIVGSVTITRPSSGFVSCISSGAADWDASNTTEDMEIGWDDAGGTGVPDSTNFIRANNTGVLDLRIPISAMHTYSVVGSGTTTYNLKARCGSCTGTELDYTTHNVMCMFFPTRY